MGVIHEIEKNLEANLLEGLEEEKGLPERESLLKGLEKKKGLPERIDLEKPLKSTKPNLLEETRLESTKNALRDEFAKQLKSIEEKFEKENGLPGRIKKHSEDVTRLKEDAQKAFDEFEDLMQDYRSEGLALYGAFFALSKICPHHCWYIGGVIMGLIIFVSVLVWRHLKDNLDQAAALDGRKMIHAARQEFLQEECLGPQDVQGEDGRGNPGANPVGAKPEDDKNDNLAAMKEARMELDEVKPRRVRKITTAVFHGIFLVGAFVFFWIEMGRSGGLVIQKCLQNCLELRY